MIENPHKRFHIDLAAGDDAILNKLAVALSKKTGLRVTRIAATTLAIRALAKKEKVA